MCFLTFSTTNIFSWYTIPIVAEKVELSPGTTHILKLTDLANTIGITPNEQGQLYWRGSDLPQAYYLASELSGQGEVFLDGPSPAWLASCLTHAIHPSKMWLADPKLEGGKIEIPSVPLCDNGSGPDYLTWTASKTADYTLVHFDLAQNISPEDLPTIRPPKTQAGLPVFISGRGPNWLATTISEAYAHEAPAVGFYQPEIPKFNRKASATIAVSHSEQYPLGLVFSTDEETIASAVARNRQELNQAIASLARSLNDDGKNGPLFKSNNGALVVTFPSGDSFVIGVRSLRQTNP